MSTVTDIILVVATDEGDDFKVRFGLKRVSGHAGGTKAMQCDVLMSAMNEYEAETHDIIEWFFHLDLKNKECAQLMIKEEHEDAFNVYIRGT